MSILDPSILISFVLITFEGPIQKQCYEKLILCSMEPTMYLDFEVLKQL